jgi:thymidine phosphorylase
VVDKHSTGGVGDKVSLVLAPMVAACGAVVPMISGRGLGHTGGTLDKLESLVGYDVLPGASTLRRVLREAGCAILGAGPRLAPADRRLYALRDVTATVESIPLITASILSKKLAAGLQALVLDVKAGQGAFCATVAEARALATCLVEVACEAGLPAQAVITDMNQVLGRTAGNALEVAEAIDWLRGERAEPRLVEVTVALGAAMLVGVGLARDEAEARTRCVEALRRGEAAERFERMVHGLGGPASACGAAVRRGLPQAPARADVPAPVGGRVAAIDTRALGLLVVRLGGGRIRPGDHVDPRVGLAGVVGLGESVEAGAALATVHAANAEDLAGAVATVAAAVRIEPGEAAGAPAPVVLEGIASPRVSTSRSR